MFMFLLKLIYVSLYIFHLQSYCMTSENLKIMHKSYEPHL